LTAGADRLVRLGEVTGVHGVRGWVKVHSFTEPRTNLFRYPDWQLELGGTIHKFDLEDGRESGKRLIAKLVGIDDRDRAAELTGAIISVPRRMLPDPEDNEYYWADLEGLRVLNLEGIELGRVVRLLATGANDVLVLDGAGDRLIPFVLDSVVRQVNLDQGTIVVDWDSSFWE